MPDDPPMHLQRDRAESFGAVAANYDRYRPSYPAELIDEFVALRPATVLDIGCGTGKAGALLVARGLDVLGVEIDPQMAEVARTHGLRVEVAPFESWADAGRRFDLVICAQAWHWVDPVAGPVKLARVLKPDATAVLFWNHSRGDIPDHLRPAFDAIYREYAPEVAAMQETSRRRAQEEDARGVHPYVADLRASGRFASVDVRELEYELTWTADEWVGMVQTHSDHLQIEPSRRRDLGDALHQAIEAQGGSLTMPWFTYCIWIRP